MPMIRTVFLGDDDVIVQLKRWWLPSWLSMAWYNYTKLSAARNAIEKEIDDCKDIESLKKVLKLMVSPKTVAFK